MQMALLSKGIFVVSAKRTPIGAYGGLLKSMTCTDIAEVAARSCLSAIPVPPEHIGSVVFGNVIQSNRDTSNLSRHTAVRVGIPISTPALTVNRLCGSGFQAVISAAHDMLIGLTELTLAGGSENMTEVPYVVRNIRFGTQLGLNYKLDDMLIDALVDHQINMPMGITAENLAEKFDISREQCDEMALRSQTRWQNAHADNVFERELCLVHVKDKKGASLKMLSDEHPRKTSMEKLSILKPAFKKNGVITAGNASGISDGAAALLLSTEEAMTRHDLKPLARFVAYSVVGCDPALMGIGPVPAVDKLMGALVPGKTGRDASTYFDMIEVNEAFSSQYLAVEQELKLDPAITNRHGGAIAMGHPVGASGARILAHLTHQLAQRKCKRALGTACIGGGQGIAVALEAV
ncbi:hypothetical protein P879_10384 [Paragonimus westermani]|uniref:Acetyl-CoA acyltransferase 2 n=1 Tax=Paragonimus westermani TaxID=34504 RepID=A0A8T0D594_9TREM|nr:hypothetical protein P879_10384 [Paragonimus westermani]